MPLPSLFIALPARSLLFAWALALPPLAFAFPTPEQIVNTYPANYDNFGTSIAMWNNRLVVGAAADHPLGAPEAGSVFVYQRQSGGPWTLATELQPSDPSANAWFGSVAIHGNTIVVGASRKASYIGAAYIFERRSGAWTQVAKLQPDSPTTSCGDPNGYCHLFGTFVAVENDVAVISAHTESGRRGAIYVFRRAADGSGWSLEQRILCPDAVSGQFGYSVKIRNGRIAVGAPNHGNGTAYIFSRQGQTWVLEARLVANDAAALDNFGVSVDIDASRALVGAYRANTVAGAHCGAAYIYERNAQGQWPQHAKLVASDCVPGVASIHGTGDQFGINVHWRNGEAYISRHPGVYSSPNPSMHGAVYRFRRTAQGSWEEVEHFTPAFASPGDGFAYDVASYGDALVASAPFEGTAPSEAINRGSVFTYDLIPADRIFADTFDGS